MKKAFLESWTGGVNSFGQSEKFKGAQGSSLSADERGVVNAGGIACHQKGSRDTKIFVEDENHGMWSVTVKNSRLAALKQKLKEAGYHLPVA
jgi:hypothetical protein